MKSQNIENIFGAVKKMTKNSACIPDSGMSVLNGLHFYFWCDRENQELPFAAFILSH